MTVKGGGRLPAFFARLNGYLAGKRMKVFFRRCALWGLLAKMGHKIPSERLGVFPRSTGPLIHAASRVMLKGGHIT